MQKSKQCIGIGFSCVIVNILGTKKNVLLPKNIDHFELLIASLDFNIL